MTSEHSYTSTIKTGIPGLDQALAGGLPRDGIYLLQGNPGVGKTTFALQFLFEAVRHGEPALYVSFSETSSELAALGEAHGWPMAKLSMHDLSVGEARDERRAEQTMFHPAEVELEETIDPLMAVVEKLKPRRIVIDSLSEIRLLAKDALRYRRQLLTLKRFFLNHDCTAILIDDKVERRNDDVAQTLVHGIIALDKITPNYGSTRRRLSIEKLRGVRYAEGYHDYRIKTGGIEVYPHLVANQHPRTVLATPLTSGVGELDALLAGGIERGTSALLMGSAGTGKSSLAAQYAIAAARRGERVIVFTFEESVHTWMTRATSLGLEPEPHVASGNLTLSQVDPAELTPGELSTKIRALVDDRLDVVVIDSLNGYMQSVPEENYLLLHMHELLTYLGQKGVTTFLIMAQQGLLGPSMQSPIDVSYLADTVVLLRYFEAGGSVRQVISVVKKRAGQHERALREMRLGRGGVQLGPPLVDFHGVLTGVPTYVGSDDPLLSGPGTRDG